MTLQEIKEIPLSSWIVAGSLCANILLLFWWRRAVQRAKWNGYLAKMWERSSDRWEQWYIDQVNETDKLRSEMKDLVLKKEATPP